MGATQWALMLLGIGIISEKFGGGKGLISLGTGVQTLIAAPLTGTGTGLSAFAGGLKDIAMTFGDIGRGISALLGGIPEWARPGAGFGGGGGGARTALPELPSGPPLIKATLPLAPEGGGNTSQLYAGGGGNVPQGYTFTPIAPSPYILQRYTVKSGLDPYGTAGWYVSNQPIVDAPAGGSVLL